MREIKVFMVCEGSDPIVVGDPVSVYEAMREEVSRLDREVFYVVCLSARNEIIGRHLVSMGSLTGSVVHPREVFKPAILSNAAAVILVHNHPSGNPAPSSEDIQITKQLVEAGKILGIRVLDHLVLGGGQGYGAETERSYVSFVDENLL